MPYPTCRHVKQDGYLCQSPALKHRDYCYYHADVRARRMAMAQARSRGEQWWLRLPPLEDMRAVQSAIAQVVEAVAADLIPLKRARVLLTGLRLAATNFRASNAWHHHSQYENDGRYSHIVSCPALEEEYGLPAGINLDADPETVFPPPPMMQPTQVNSTAAPGFPVGEAERRAPLEPRSGDSVVSPGWSAAEPGVGSPLHASSRGSGGTHRAPQPETAPGLIDEDLDEQQIVKKARALARKAVVHLRRTGAVPAEIFKGKKEERKAPASDHASAAAGKISSARADGTA